MAIPMIAAAFAKVGPKMAGSKFASLAPKVAAKPLHAVRKAANALPGLVEKLSIAAMSLAGPAPIGLKIAKATLGALGHSAKMAMNALSPVAGLAAKAAPALKVAKPRVPGLG